MGTVQVTFPYVLTVATNIFEGQTSNVLPFTPSAVYVCETVCVCKRERKANPYLPVSQETENFLSFVIEKPRLISSVMKYVR